MPDFRNMGLLQKAALWSPYTSGTDLMHLPLGGLGGTPPFAPGQPSGQTVQQQQGQKQADDTAKQQSEFWDKTIVPGYYMGQMASAMGGGPAGGAVAGAASAGLGMLYNYFANKYNQPDSSGTYGEGAPVGHGIPSTSTQYGDD